MSLLGFSLVLTAAFCHATWNFFVKRIGGGPELVWLFSVISVAIYLPVAIAIWVLEEPEFGLREVLFTAGSAGLHLGYFLLLQRGYRNSDLSVVYPVARATGPLLSTILAVFVLGEQISLQAAGGGLIVIFGVVALSGGLRADLRTAFSSVSFGMAAGMLVGAYTAWDAYTVAVLLVPPLLLDYVSSVARAIVLTPYAGRHRQTVAAHWRDHRIGVLCIAVFNPLAYILVLYALTFTPVIYVAPLREVSVLIAVLAGALLLGEGQLRSRFAYAGLVVAGVGLLATG